MNERNSAISSARKQELISLISTMTEKEQYFALRLILCMKAIPDGETIETCPQTKDIVGSFMQDCKDGKIHTQHQYFDYIKAMENALQLDPPSAQEAEPSAPAKRKHVQFDSTALKARILERFGTYKSFAAAMGTRPKTLSHWLNSKTQMGLVQLEKMANLLGIKPNEIDRYFFCSGSNRNH